MNLTQIKGIVLVRRRLFLCIVGGFVLTALLASLIMHKTYQADAEVVVDSKSTDTVTGAILPALLQANVVATQVDIISSHAVAARVVDKLNLTVNDEYHKKFISASQGISSERDWIADYLLKRLDVVPSRDSNVIDIRFAAHSARLAADIANAFADSYIQANLEINADPAKRQAEWFTAQLSGLRKVVETARQRLADFQRLSNIVGTPEEHLDVDNAKLAEISTELVAAQQAMYDAHTRLSQMNQALARDQGEELPDILANPLLQSLKTSLTLAESNFAQISSHFDHKHPQYLDAEASVKTLRKRFAAELTNAEGSVVQAAQLSDRRVDELTRALDQQKQYVIGISHKHDTLAALNKDVDNAQATYDAAIARANQVTLQGQLDQSNIAVLSAAVPPDKQSRPRPLLYMVLALALGALMALGAVIALEHHDRRLRTRSDLIDTLGILVLAEVPRLSAPLSPG